MKNRTIFTSFILIFLTIIAGAFFYSQLSEQVVSHWNIEGEADGYLLKFWEVF